MNEAKLKSELMAVLRPHIPGAVCLRHEDKLTSGIPDISVTWGNRTSWWEVKYADPRLESKGIQDVTMMKLAGAGTANYIIYYEFHDLQRVIIAEPRMVISNTGERVNDWMTHAISASGFDHKWVAGHIRGVHEYARNHR